MFVWSVHYASAKNAVNIVILIICKEVQSQVECSAMWHTVAALQILLNVVGIFDAVHSMHTAPSAPFGTQPMYIWSALREGLSVNDLYKAVSVNCV